MRFGRDCAESLLSELTLVVWSSMGVPENSWLASQLIGWLTSQLSLLRRGDETKFPLASEKSISAFVWGPGRRGKQGMSRSSLTSSWARDLKSKGFYAAGKVFTQQGVHFHCRCVHWKHVAFQRSKNIFFTNALLAGKFQESSILFHMLTF